MPWLAELVQSSEGSLDVLPVQCLCEFLLMEQQSAEKTNEETNKKMVYSWYMPCLYEVFVLPIPTHTISTGSPRWYKVDWRSNYYFIEQPETCVITSSLSVKWFICWWWCNHRSIGIFHETFVIWDHQRKKCRHQGIQHYICHLYC